MFQDFELIAFGDFGTTICGEPIQAFPEEVAKKVRLVNDKNIEVGDIKPQADGSYHINVLPQYRNGGFRVSQGPTAPEAAPAPVEAPYSETEEVGTPNNDYFSRVTPSGESLKEESDQFERELSTIKGKDVPQLPGGETPDIVPPFTPSDNPVPMSNEPQVGPGMRKL